MSWRETLFVWKGEGSFHEQNNNMKWEGKWCGTEQPDVIHFPTENEFNKSKMLFSVSSKYNEENKQHQLDMLGKGWLLDDMEYHSDTKHTLKLYDTKISGQYIVFAKGNNDFSNFISIGLLEKNKDNKNIFTMTLARRYLEEDDERIMWSLKKLNYLYIKYTPEDKAVPIDYNHPLFHLSLNKKDILKLNNNSNNNNNNNNNNDQQEKKKKRDSSEISSSNDTKNNDGNSTSTTANGNNNGNNSNKKKKM